MPLVIVLLVRPFSCFTFLLMSPLLDALLRPNFIFFIKLVPDEANAEAAAETTGVLEMLLLPLLLGAAFSLPAAAVAADCCCCALVVALRRSLGQLT